MALYYRMKINFCRAFCRANPIHCLKRFSSLPPNFVVRTLASADEAREIIGTRAAAWGRKPGALDYDIYFATDNTGFYVGELDGKAVGCMAAVKFSKNFAFLGSLVVDEVHRGLGYGSAIFDAGVAALPQECNFACDIHEEKIPLFETKFRYKLAWKAKRVTVIASSAAVSDPGFSSVKVSIANEIPFTKIMEYDAPFHNFDRFSFLRRWMFAPNCHSYVATDSSGSVVGYSVVRSTLRPGDGWRISPLYANNAQTAKSLYQAIFRKTSSKDPLAMVTFDVPCIESNNSAALHVAYEHSAEIDEHIARLYRYHIPSYLPVQQIFVM